MQQSRRDFFKAATVGAIGATVFGFDLKPAYAQLKELKIARATETRSTCPYCAVGCGVLIYTIGDRAKNVTPQVIHVEGDPDHPTNRGTLCPKGSSLEQDMLNPRRLTEAASPASGRDRLARYFVGRGARRNRAVDQENARQHLCRERCARPHRQPLRRHLLHWRLHRHQ